MFVYDLQSVVKTRRFASNEFRLHIPNLQIEPQEKIALVGPSGCGKSTLLDILAMVLSPSRADTFNFRPRETLHKQNVNELWRRNRRNRLSDLRGRYIGYVLQTGGLLPFVSVYDNIVLPSRLLGRTDETTLRAVAHELGIGAHLGKLPGSLSVGERQRVAIARALVHSPSIVIADEPTASLDPLTAEKTMVLFIRLAGQLGLTIIIASHDVDFMMRLGLRQLNHRFISDPNSNATVSEFTG